MNIELIPIRIPDYIIQKTPPKPRSEGLTESPKYHLSEVDEQTLSQLCDDFRAGVFAKAGKVDPSHV